MDALLLLLALIATVSGMLLLVDVADRALDEHRPGYGHAWARVFGETDPPRPLSHVRAISPDPCRGCQSIGPHLPGCIVASRPV